MFDQTLKAIRDFRRFIQLQESEKTVVFYSEDRQSWVHFESIILKLTTDCKICYVTSHSDDPILKTENPNILPLYIGSGVLRTTFFSLMQTTLCVMTVPDLQTFQLKRSKIAKVHYCYVFHSMVSTHMAYREGALDHFDSILCVGPHHLREIRAREERRHLSKKRLFEVGYGRLDSILANRSECLVSDLNHILIAPSHGKNALIEQCGELLISTLLRAGYRVTLRPHPMTLKSSQMIERILNTFRSESRFTFETNVESTNSLASSSVMVSDWSGVALEYAFGLEKPVLFIDVPRKVNNPCYQEISHEPIEVGLRSQIGKVLSPNEIHLVPSIIADWNRQTMGIKGQLRALREQHIYNVGRSGEAGANAIRELLKISQSANNVRRLKIDVSSMRKTSPLP